MNKVFLKGRLVKDVVTKSTPSGLAIANFTIATEENYKGKDGTWQKESEFHNCVAFGKTAEKLSVSNKGENLIVIGKIKTESWEKEGKKNYSTKIYADHVEGWISQKIGQQSVINQEFQVKSNDLYADVDSIPF